jgi:hypothetical protein
MSGKSGRDQQFGGHASDRPAGSSGETIVDKQRLGARPAGTALSSESCGTGTYDRDVTFGHAVCHPVGAYERRGTGMRGGRRTL